MLVWPIPEVLMNQRYSSAWFLLLCSTERLTWGSKLEHQNQCRSFSMDFLRIFLDWEQWKNSRQNKFRKENSPDALHPRWHKSQVPAAKGTSHVLRRGSNRGKPRGMVTKSHVGARAHWNRAFQGLVYSLEYSIIVCAITALLWMGKHKLKM